MPIHKKDAPLIAIDIDQISKDALVSSMEAAPRYEAGFAVAARQIVRTIHSIKSLHQDTELGELEFYVGRASGTAEHVRNRWKEHSTKKEHESAVVVFEAESHLVAKWEGLANKLIKILKTRQKICVANIAANSSGGKSSTDFSVVYLTWKTVPREPINKLLAKDVEAVARQLFEDANGEITMDTAIRAIDPITKPTQERLAIEWAEGESDYWADE
jgi:hypothetical protein